MPAVEREIISLLPTDTLYNFHVTSVSVGDVERATKPESIAMAVFGIIAGLATLVIGGQAIGRRIASRREELAVLRALGAAPSVTIADSLIGPTSVVLVGVVVAMVLAISAVAADTHRRRAPSRSVARFHRRLDRYWSRVLTVGRSG